MKTKHSLPSSDIEIIGKDTTFIAVTGRLTEERRWLIGTPECAFLAAHNIAHSVGFASIQSFPNAFKARFARPPSDFR